MPASKEFFVCFVYFVVLSSRRNKNRTTKNTKNTTDHYACFEELFVCFVYFVLLAQLPGSRYFGPSAGSDSATSFFPASFLTNHLTGS
jgi:hypothetical protein